MDLRILLLSLAVLATASAGPINFGQTKCSRKCTGSDKFRYAPGTTYTYSYDGSVMTKIHGSMEHGSGLHMLATADIEVLDKCNLVLKLKHVRLEETDARTNRRIPVDGSSRFGNALEEQPLHFSFQDGRIEEVCEAEERKWVLNIKRGVLSAFQNSMEDLKKATTTKEVDVAGECDAEYNLGETAWRSFSIVKKKNLLACKNRQAAKTALQATPYKMDSGIQSLPLTRGTHMCQHDIHNNGYLLKSDCKEEHVFRPFSKEGNGATTTASHRLVFTGESAGVSAKPLRGSFRRTNLLYEHEPEPEKKSRDMTAAMDTLKSICTEMKHDVRPGTPRLFSDLVYRLKEMDTRTLSKLYRYVNNNGVCKENHQAAKKFFMDAIPMVGTSASVALISDLVGQKVIQGSEAEMWLSSLAFIQQPTTAMMGSVKSLIESVNAGRTTFLAGSALVNNYCKDKPSCSRDTVILQIASLLEGKLSSNCKTRNDKEKDRVMMTLKALGNMGFAPRATATIARCMLEASNPTEVRLAAIDALRRQPCDEERSRVLTLFSDANEDSEIRIHAYLAAMQCATPAVVETVRNVLKNEKVNQVGSFIWTHLTNLKETSDPLKQDLRKVLENKHLQKEFDLDSRKYSRNFEGSFFSDSLNAGATVDGNLIWSPKSFVPRSGMMNLTVDLFGSSVNLLEVGGRVEGLEHMMEKFFGNKGYFPNNNVKNMLSNRGKRSVFDDKINRIDQEFNKVKKDALKGSMYFKVFGHELNYVDLAGLSGKGDFNVLELLIKLASNHEINYSKSVMFLDTTVTIPTVLGLPLKLSINGTATVNLQISGKFDVRQAFTSPRSMDVTGHIKPSGAVDISSMMTIDAHVVRAGLKMVTNLHSSTEVDGSIKMKDGQVFVTKINMPREKIEILNAENKFFLVSSTEEVEQTMPQTSRITKNKCTGRGLAEVLGLQLCGEISHPAFDAKDASFAALMGPSRMSVYLNKKDTMTGYEFEAKFQTRKDRKNGQTSVTHVARVAFDTPGSKVNRKFAVDFLLNQGERILNFNLVSPWQKVALNGEMTTENDNKQANLRLVLNDKDEYAFISQLRMSSKHGRTTFSPNIEVRIPKRRPVTVTGMLDYVNERKMDVNLVMENLFRTPVTLKGGVDKDVRGSKTRYSANLDVKSHFIDTKLSGYVENKPSMYKSRMTLEYRLQAKPQQRVSLSYKLRNVDTVSMRKISLDTSVQTTQFPDYNFELSTDVQKTSSHAESSVDFRYGADANDPYRRIAATAIVNYDINGDKMKADGSAKLNFPAKNVDFNMKINHNHDPKAIESKAMIEYMPGKNVNIELNLRDLSERLLKMTGDITVELPSRILAMSHQLEERLPQEYHHNMFVQWQRGKQVQVTSMYRAEGKTHTVTSNIQLPGRLPVNVNAETTIDPLNFAGSVQVNFERKIYGVDIGYNFKNTDKELFVLGRFDAKHPSRRVTGLGMIKRKGDDYATKWNVQWDADRDNTKSVTVEGEYKLEQVYRGSHHAGTFLVAALGRQGTITTDLLYTNEKYQSTIEAQWEANKKMTLNAMLTLAEKAFDASVKFTSPFSFVEDIGASLTHRRMRSEISTNGEVTWAVGKSIKVETTFKPRSAKNMEAIITASTPFRGYRTMRGNALYALDETSFAGTLEGTLERRKIGMILSGSIANGVIGNLKIDIPQLAQPITAKLSHKDSNGMYETSAEMAWSLKKISALLKVKPVSRNDMEFTMAINTPFKRFTTITLQGIHKINSEGINTKVFGQYETKKIGAEMTAKYTFTYHARNLEAAVKVNTPFQGFEEMGVAVKHSDDGHRFSSGADATWDDKKIGAALYMTNSIRGWTLQSTGRLNVFTPFSGYERSFYNWRHNNDHHGVTSSHSVTVSGMRYTMAVHGKQIATKSSNTFEAKLNIQTPHEVAKNLDAEMTFQLTPSNIKANALLGRSATDKIQVGAEVSYDAYHNFLASMNLDLSAVTDKVKAVTATVKGQVQSMPYTTHVEVGWSKEKMVIDFSLTPHSWRHFESSMTVQTPFFIAKRVGAKVMSTFVDNALNTIVTSQFNDKKVEVHINGNNKGTTDKVDMEGHVRVVNPFSQDVTMGMSFTKENKKMGARLIGAYGRYKTEAGFETEFDMSNRIATKGNAGLVLPLYGEQKMSYAWDLSTDMKSTFNTQNTFSWNEKSLTTNADFSVVADSYGSTHKATLTLKTPFDLLHEAKVNFDHIKRGNACTTNLRVSRNRRQALAYNMEMAIDTMHSMEGTGKLTISEMEPITVSFKSLTRDSPYTGRIELMWGQQKVGVYGTLQHQGWDLINGALTLNTPLDYLKKVAMKLNHQKKGSALVTSVSLEYQPRKVITLTTHFDNRRKQTGTLTLSTPFQGLNKVAFSYEHEGSGKSFTHMHNIEYEGMDKTMAMSNTINYRGPQYVTGSTHFRTPLEWLREVKFNFVHQEERSSYNTNFNIEVEEGKKIEASSVISKSENPTFTLTVKSPYEYLTSLTANFMHRGQFPYTTTSGSFEMQNRFVRASVTSEVKMQGYDSLTANLRVITPIKYYEHMFVGLTHGKVRGEWRSTLEGQMDMRKRLNVKTTFSMEDNVQGGVVITIPHIGMDKLALSFEHEGSFSTFTIRPKFEMKWQGETTEMQGQLHVNSWNDMEFTVDGTTPYSGHQTVNIAAHQRKSGSTRMITATMDTPAGKSEFTGKFETGSTKKMEIDIKTPYSFLQTLTLDLERRREGWTNFYHKLDINYVNYLTRLVLNYEVTINNLHDMEGKFHLTSPIKHLEYVNAAFTHKIKDLHCIATVDVEYAPRKQISFKYICDKVRPMNIEMYLTTPFEAYKDMSLKVSHQGKGIIFLNKVYFTLNKKKIVNSEVTMYGLWHLKGTTDINGKTLTIDHLVTDKKTETRLSLKELADFLFNYEKSRHGYTSKMSLNTQHELIRSMGIVAEHAYENGMQTVAHASYDGTMGPSRIEARIDFRDINYMTGNVHINAPFMKETKLILDHKYEDEKYQSLVNIMYGNNKIAEMKSTISTSPFDIDATLDTPFDFMRRMVVKINHSGREMYFTNRANIMISTAANSLSIDATTQARGLHDMNGRMNIRSSLFDDVMVSFNRNVNSGIKTADITVQLTPARKIVLTTEYQRTRDLAIKTTLRTPWEIMKTITADVLVANHETFHTKVEITHNMLSQPIMVDVEVRNSEALEGKAIFTSSLPLMKRIEAGFKIEEDGNTYHTEGSLTYNENTVSMTSDLTIQSLNQMSGKVTLMTPFRRFSTIIVNMEHNGNMDNFVTKVDVEADNSGKFEMTATLNTEDRIEGSVTINAPFMQPTKITLMHKMSSWSRCSSKAAVAYGNKEVSVESTIHVDDLMNFDGSLLIKIPHDDIPYVRMSVSHHGELTNFHNQGAIETRYGGFRMNSNFRLEEDLEANVHIETPWSQFSHVMLGLKHAGNMEKCKTVMTLDSNHYGKMEVTGDWAKTPLAAKITIDTPYFDKTTAGVKYLREGKTFQIEATASYGPKAFSYFTKVTKRSWTDFNSELLITTPFKYSDIKATYRHGGDASRFITMFTVETNVFEKVEMEAIYRNSPLSLTANVKTPWSGYRDIKGVFSHSGDSDAFSTALNINADGELLGVVSGEWSKAPKMSARILVDTPFHEEITAMFTHECRKPVYKTNAQLTYGTKKGSFGSTITVRNVNDVNVELTLTTPFDEVRTSRAQYMHQGTLEALTGLVSFEKNSENQVSVEVEWSKVSKIEGKFTMKSVFLDDVIATITHDQGRKNYETHASFSLGDKTFSFGSNMELNSLERFNGVVTMKTPIPGHRNRQVTFHHGGDHKKFSTSIQVQCADHGQSTLNLQWNYGSKTTAYILLETPFFVKFVSDLRHVMKSSTHHKTDLTTTYGSTNFYLKNEIKVPSFTDMSVKTEMTIPDKTYNTVFTHKGDLEEFTTNLKLYSGNDVIAQAIADWNLEEMKAEAKVITPFEGYKVLNAKFDYDLEESHKVEMVLEKDNKIIKMTGTLSSASAGVTVYTPFQGYDKMFATFNLNQGRSSYDGTAKLMIKRGEQMILNFRFNQEDKKVNFAASLETPYKYAEYTRLFLSHNGDLEQFQTEAKVTYMRNKHIGVNMNFNTENKVELTANLQTPFEVAESTTFYLSHSGAMTNCRTNAKLTYMRDQVVEVNTNFNMESNIQVTASLKTPFEGAEFSEFVMTHTGGLENFKTEAKLMYMNDQIIEASAQFSGPGYENLELTATLKTPFLNAENSIFTFTHEGPLGNCKTHAKLTYMRNNVIEYNMELNKNKFAASLTTPYENAESTELVLMRSGTLQNFNTNAKFTYMKDQVIDFNMKFIMQGMIDLEATLMTPFENAENSVLTFNANKDGQVDAKLNFMQNKVIEYNMKFTIYELDVTLKTPFSGAEYSRLTLAHQGESDHFNWKAKVIYMRNQVIQYSMTFKKGNAISFTANLKTPFQGAEDTTFTLSHSGTITNFETNVKLNYMRNKVIQTIAQFNSEEDITAFAQLRTPFTGLETTELTFSHTGGKTAFKTNAKLDYMNNKRIDATFTFLNNEMRRIEIDAQIRTPYENARNTMLTFKHNGDTESFNTNAKVLFMNNQEFECNLNFQNAEKLEVSTTIKTPFKGAERIAARYTHSGNLEKFECDAHVQYESKKPITANLKFQMTPTIELTANLAVFDYKPASASFVHSGDRQRFTQTASMKWEQEMSYKVEFSRSGERSFVLNWESFNSVMLLKPFTMKLNHFAEKNIRTTIAFFIGDKELTDVKFMYEPNSLNFQYKNPFRSFTINHEGSMSNFRSVAKYSTHRGKNYVLEANFNMENKMTGSLNVETPYGNLAYDHEGSIEKFKCNAVVTRDGETYQMDISFDKSTMAMMLKLTTPQRRVEIDHLGFLKAFKTKVIASCPVRGTYQYDMNLNTVIGAGMMKMTAPQGTIELIHKSPRTGYHTKFVSTCTFTGRYVAEMNLNKDNVAADLTVNTPYGNALITHNGRLESFNTKATANIGAYGAFTTEATFNLNRMTGKLILSTPYGNGQLTHNGQSRDFTTSGTATIMGKSFNFVYKLNRNTYTSSLKLTGPRFEITMTHTGPITNFNVNSMARIDGRETTLEASFNFDKKITGSFLYKCPTFEKLALTFSHHGDLRFFETDGSVSWSNSHTISAHVDFRRNRRYIVVNTKLNTPFTDAFSLNARHQGQWGDFRSSMNADYGSKRFQFLTILNKESATVSLMTPFQYFESLSASYKKNQNNGYNAEISWAPRKKIIATVTYNFDGSYSAAAATGKLIVTTPFEAVRTLNIEFENRHSLFTYLKNILKLELNSDRVWDTKAEIRIAADRVDLQATMSIPHPVTVNVKLFNSKKEKTADLDINVSGKKVYLTAFHKDESTYYRVKRESSVKLIVPRRTMALTSNFDSSRYQSNHKVELTLDQERNKKITYEGSIADRSRSYQKSYEITGKLTTPLRSLKSKVTYTQDSAAYNTKIQMMWDADRDQDKMMEVATVYRKTGQVHNVKATLTHPRLSKPISIRGEITLNKADFIYAGKTEVEYSSDPSEILTLSGKVNDESRGRRQNYSMSMRVSHPKSLINMGMTSHIGNTDTKMSAGIGMNYLTARRSEENVLLRGEIDKLRKSMNLQLRTPIKDFAIDGSMNQPSRGVWKFQLLNTFGSTRLNHELEINTKKPSFAVNMNYEPGKFFKLSAKTNKTFAEIKSGRHDGRHMYTDTQASLTLNASNVLLAKLHWKPEMLREIEKYAVENLATAQTTLSQTWDDVISAVNDEMMMHSALIKRSLPDVAAVRNYVMTEADAFVADGERIRDEWENMYERNEFFMRDIDEYLTIVSEYIREKATHLQFQLRRYTAEWNRSLQAKLAMYRRAWDEKMGKLEETIAAVVLKFRPAWQSYAYAMIRSYQETSQKMKHRLEESMETMGEYKANMVNFLDDRFDFITYKMEPYFEKLGGVQDNVRYYLLSDKQKTYLDVAKEKVVNFIQAIRNTVQEWRSDVTLKTQEAIRNTKEAIRRNLEEILGHEYSQMVINMAQQAVVEMKSAYTDYEIEAKLKDLMKSAYYKLDDYARKQVKTLVKNYIRMGESGFTVFEPENGAIEGKIFLPLEVKSLDQLPELKLDEMKLEMNKLVHKYKPNSDFSIWDVYYKYKPTSDVMNWVPPFKAHATLAHGKHYTTFDGRHFEFAGTCSSLLARDFSDANFTLTANYKDGFVRSYTIMSNNKRIEIFPDFKLKVNDARTEMPYEFMNTTVSRDANTIRVTNTKGMTFTFDVEKDIATLDISGWYFAKTAGLFGTYDNEPSNDFTLPNHKVTDNMDTFTAAWEVAPFCRGSRNLALTRTTQPGSEVEKACKKFFQDGASPFRPCFSVVPPKTFYDRCVSDLEQDYTRKPAEEKACRVMYTYAAECKKAEVELKVPEKCATCQGPRGDLMYPQDTVTFNAADIPTTSSADVIFVVEEKQCNKEIAGKLSDMAMQTEKSLKTKGMRNNRFAVIAFGGHDVHNPPHFHTMEDQIFNEARKMNLVQLDFHKDGPNTDVLSAVKFAAKSQFRAGVSKTVVLIPCSSCGAQSTSYRQLLNLLKDEEITFHVIKEHDFKLHSNSPKSSYIFGIDSNSAYTGKDINDDVLEGDRTLFRQVVVPNDNCVYLAHERKGSIFNGQKLTTGRYAVQKSFLDIVGRRVAKTAVVSQRQECRCVVDETGNARSVCKSLPVQMTQLVPAKQHLLGHMGENPEAEPLPTPPTMEYEELPLHRDQTSVRVLGQKRPQYYRGRQ